MLSSGDKLRIVVGVAFAPVRVTALVISDGVVTSRLF